MDISALQGHGRVVEEHGSTRAVVTNAQVQRLLPRNPTEEATAQLAHVVDLQFLPRTSARFSFRAEHGNVEYGLLVRDAASAEGRRSIMTRRRGATIHELVTGGSA